MKKTLYPKTERYNPKKLIQITEKINGECIGFAKDLDGNFMIIQRNNFFTLFCNDHNEIDFSNELSVISILYKQLHDWLLENGEMLFNELHSGSVIFGEWVHSNSGTYTQGHYGDSLFKMFAKANIDEYYIIGRYKYDHDLFKYPFMNVEIPSYIDVVPFINKMPMCALSLEFLNRLYERYTRTYGIHVEGFVIEIDGMIKKYVRKKENKTIEHFWKD